ncbi:MAG: alanine racemase [Defluviitaleaceae bacterium]|nr:alanine racemase [Defluviitaleaceae bacterium]
MLNYQRTWAEINLAHILHNLSVLKTYTTSPIMGIVKADGYGHGAIPVAQTLIKGGVDALGVAICEEGAILRENGITCPILIMGFTPEPLLPAVVHHNLTQTIFAPHGADVLAEQATKYGKQATVHIKIDTGMSRLGFLPNEKSIEEICKIAENPNLNIEGIYTHCATSDALDASFMFEQQRRFEWVIRKLIHRGLNIPIKHFANSGAFVQTLRGIHVPFYNYSRLGILLYGHPPSLEMAEVCAKLDLKPAMRLFTQVSMVKQLPTGTGISYGHIYKTTRPSTIAVLPVGYADGYPRRLSYGGQVMINGRFAPIAGAICMDQCMADVTDIPNVAAGDSVIILGSSEEGIGADCLAHIVGTISYEILCGIGKRVPRIYV